MNVKLIVAGMSLLSVVSFAENTNSRSIPTDLKLTCAILANTGTRFTHRFLEFDAKPGIYTLLPSDAKRTALAQRKLDLENDQKNVSKLLLEQTFDKSLLTPNNMPSADQLVNKYSTYGDPIDARRVAALKAVIDHFESPRFNYSPIPDATVIWNSALILDPNTSGSSRIDLASILYKKNGDIGRKVAAWQIMRTPNVKQALTFIVQYYEKTSDEKFVYEFALPYLASRDKIDVADLLRNNPTSILSYTVVRDHFFPEFIENIKKGNISGPELQIIGIYLFDDSFNNSIHGNFQRKLGEALLSSEVSIKLLDDPSIENTAKEFPKFAAWLDNLLK